MNKIRHADRWRAVVLLLASIVIVGVWTPRSSRIDAMTAAQNRPAGITQVADGICRFNAGRTGTALLGFWWELSPSLVSWRCLHLNPSLRLEQIPRPPLRLGLSAHDPDWQKFINDPAVERIVLVEYNAPERQQFERDLAPLLPLRDLVRGGEIFVLDAALSFPGTPYRVEFFRRR